jgi:hypothetical protein
LRCCFGRIGEIGVFPAGPREVQRVLTLPPILLWPSKYLLDRFSGALSPWLRYRYSLLISVIGIVIPFNCLPRVRYFSLLIDLLYATRIEESFDTRVAQLRTSSDWHFGTQFYFYYFFFCGKKGNKLARNGKKRNENIKNWRREGSSYTISIPVRRN